MVQRKRKLNPVKNPLFKPVWRIPVVLDMYRGGGKRSKLVGSPPLWLQVAIESGLVEMYEPKEGEYVGWLEQIDKTQVIPKYTNEDIERMLTEGLEKTLDDLEKKDDK